jgi:hypothetical protein
MFEQVLLLLSLFPTRIFQEKNKALIFPHGFLLKKKRTMFEQVLLLLSLFPTRIFQEKNKALIFPHGSFTSC